jgi:hypothetical protein
MSCSLARAPIKHWSLCLGRSRCSAAGIAATSESDTTASTSIPSMVGDDQMSKLVGIRVGCQLPHLGRVPAVPGHPQKYRSSCARVSDPAKRP